MTASHPRSSGRPKLCYVEDSWAWFTTTSLGDQTGDDWNDAPYEHNAGRPYEWRPYMLEKYGIEPYELVRLAWRATDLYPPAEGRRNSPWCVDDINAGQVGWLVAGVYGGQGARSVVHAGATPEEFAQVIEAYGGKVYFAREGAA